MGRPLWAGSFLTPRMVPCFHPIPIPNTEFQPFSLGDRSAGRGALPCSDPPTSSLGFNLIPDLRISSLQGHLQLLHCELEGARFQPSDLKESHKSHPPDSVTSLWTGRRGSHLPTVVSSLLLGQSQKTQDVRGHFLLTATRTSHQVRDSLTALRFGEKPPEAL